MGRTPHTPAVTPDCGRDHHVDGYSVFLAGGGFRGGYGGGYGGRYGGSGGGYQGGRIGVGR